MMRRALMGVIVGVGLLGFAGCGGDDSKSLSNVEDPATIKSAQSLGDGSQAFTGFSDNEAQGQGIVQQVGSAVQGFAGAHIASKAQGAQGSVTGLLRQALAAQDGSGNFFSYEEGRIRAHFDLDSVGGTGIPVGGGAAQAVHYVYDLDLEVSREEGHRYDGHLDMALSLSVDTGGLGAEGIPGLGGGGMMDYEYTYEAKYDGFTLNTSGCPVGGSITVDYALKVSGDYYDNLPASAKSSMNTSGRVKAEFGPDCGAEPVVTGD